MSMDKTFSKFGGERKKCNAIRTNGVLHVLCRVGLKEILNFAG